MVGGGRGSGGIKNLCSQKSQAFLCVALRMCVAHSGCSIHFSPMLCQEKLVPVRGLMSPRPNVSAVSLEALSQTATQRQQNRAEDLRT